MEICNCWQPLDKRSKKHFAGSMTFDLLLWSPGMISCMLLLKLLLVKGGVVQRGLKNTWFVSNVVLQLGSRHRNGEVVVINIDYVFESEISYTTKIYI